MANYAFNMGTLSLANFSNSIAIFFFKQIPLCLKINLKKMLLDRKKQFFLHKKNKKLWQPRSITHRSTT